MQLVFSWSQDGTKKVQQRKQQFNVLYEHSHTVINNKYKILVKDLTTAPMCDTDFLKFLAFPKWSKSEKCLYYAIMLKYDLGNALSPSAKHEKWHPEQSIIWLKAWDFQSHSPNMWSEKSEKSAVDTLFKVLSCLHNKTSMRSQKAWLGLKGWWTHRYSGKQSIQKAWKLQAVPPCFT